jgi:hypothetical protein
MAAHFDTQVTPFRSRPLDAGPYTFVWVDALTVKVREDGRVVNADALLATGVNADGHRKILAFPDSPTIRTSGCCASSGSGTRSRVRTPSGGFRSLERSLNHRARRGLDGQALDRSASRGGAAGRRAAGGWQAWQRSRRRPPRRLAL